MLVTQSNQKPETEVRFFLSDTRMSSWYVMSSL
jgi:hypothetical protein